MLDQYLSRHFFIHLPVYMIRTVSRCLIVCCRCVLPVLPHQLRMNCGCLDSAGFNLWSSVMIDNNTIIDLHYWSQTFPLFHHVDHRHIIYHHIVCFLNNHYLTWVDNTPVSMADIRNLDRVFTDTTAANIFPCKHNILVLRNQDIMFTWENTARILHKPDHNQDIHT